MTGQPPDQITALLLEVQSGSSDAPHRLMPVVYGELKILAAGYLRAEAPLRESARVRDLRSALARLYEATGRLEQAASYRE